MKIFNYVPRHSSTYLTYIKWRRYKGERPDVCHVLSNRQNGFEPSGCFSSEDGIPNELPQIQRTPVRATTRQTSFVSLSTAHSTHAPYMYWTFLRL